MKVIGLVGRAGAGKDTVAGMMEQRYPSVRMGDVVIEETMRRGLELSDENVGAVADGLRRAEGMDAIARRCLSRIEALRSSIVLINGIRGVDEVRFFRESFPDFQLVEVYASERTRYERIRQRSREDDVKDFDQFLARDSREGAWGLQEAIDQSDYRINNNGSLEELQARTAEIMDAMEAGG